MLPRKYVIVPVLASMFLIPFGQQIVIGTVHLFVCRILILAAFVRALSSKVPKQQSNWGEGWNSIDTAFTCYVGITTAATMMLYPDAGALANQIGYLWDHLIGYLLLRSLIRDDKDTFLAIKCFAGLMVVLAIAMVIEQIKMVNVFGLLGGVTPVPGAPGRQDSFAGGVPACFDGRNFCRDRDPALFSTYGKTVRLRRSASWELWPRP